MGFWGRWPAVSPAAVAIQEAEDIAVDIEGPSQVVWGAMAAAPDKQQEAAQPSFGHMDTQALSQMNET